MARQQKTMTAAFLAGAGALLLGGIGVTSAAYIDVASVNGQVGSGVFSAQVRDAAGEWHEADTSAEAVPVQATPEAGNAQHAEAGTVSNRRVSVYTLETRLAPGSPAGSISPRLTVLDGCDARCAELFDHLRFTVDVGDQRIADQVSAADFNGLTTRGISLNGSDPAAAVRLEVRLAPETPFAWSGGETRFGVIFEGTT